MPALVVLCSSFAAAGALLRFAPRLLARSPSAVLHALVAMSAVLAAFAPPEPTGWVVTDVLLRVAVGGGAAAAARRAHPAVTLWAATAATVVLLVADSPAWFAAAAGAGLVFASVLAGERAPVLLVVAGGAAAQTVLRLDWPVATGASLVAGGLAITPLLVAGTAASSRRVRRWLLAAMTVAVVVGLAGAGAGGAAALRARDDVDRGVAAAREGLALLGSGDRDAARGQLVEAAEAFRVADDQLREVWARPAFAIPIVAQHARAVATLADAGAQLAEAAVDTLDRADPDAVRPRGGRVDLDAVRALAGPLQDALDALDRADQRLAAIESPWLVTPVADRRDELHGRVVDALDDAETAAAAARVAPALLGGDGPRRYLVVVMTPAESTGGGGFVGNFGELVADDGRIELARFGRNLELTDGGPDPDARRIEGQEEYQRRYGYLRPERYWGVINSAPHFPTVADVMAQLYPQSGGAEVDGVIAVDPFAIAALLEALGPLSVDGWPEPLTSGNAARILLHEQYLRFPSSDDDDPGGDASAERVDFLGTAATALFSRITEGDLPGAGRLATALGPAVRGRHLLLSARAPEEERFFARIGAAGALPRPRGDVIGVVGQNYNGNKIDWFLHRKAVYDVDWDPATGAVRGEYTLDLRNEAPATGLPHAVIGWGGDESLGQTPVADGENLMLLQLYSAYPVSSLTVDGNEVDYSDGVERGLHVAVFFVRLAPGGAATVRAVVEGRTGDETYRFEPVRQGMANPDELEVDLTVADGWQLDGVAGLEPSGTSTARATWSLEERRTVAVGARPDDESLLDRLRGRAR